MKFIYVFTIFLLALPSVLSLTALSYTEEAKAWNYFEFPTETWIIEKQDYFGSWLEWNFVPVDGQHGDKRVWNFTWRHLLYLEKYNETTGEPIEFIENPIFEIREAYGNETWLRQIYDKTERLQFKSWGDFKSDVARLAKYPIVPEDKEEFTGLHTDIDILNFDNGSFLVSFKDKWKAGKKITIGFASTITYSGVTNTITCTGGTEGSPITFWDLWNASDANGWDVVNNTCNTQFKFWCKLQIGDGTTETWFADIGKQIVFSAELDDYAIRGLAQATFRLGVLEDASKKTTSNGCSIIFLANDKGIYRENYPYTAKTYFYSSHFSGVKTFVGLIKSGGDRIWNCIFTKAVRLYDLDGVDIYGIIIQNPTDYGLQLIVNCVLDKITVTGCPNSAIWVFSNLPFSVKNVVAKDNAKFITLSSSTVDSYVIDSETDAWTFNFYGVCTGKLYRQYTFNLQVQYPNSTAIQNANVSLWNNQGLVGSWLTDANGKIAEQTLTMGYYDQANGDTLQTYNPYNLTITKTGRQTYTKNFTLSDKTDWTIALQTEGAAATYTSAILVGFLFLAIPVVALIVFVRRK